MPDPSQPIAVVSCDSHIGPPLDLLRPYCPQVYLDDFDAFAAEHHAFDVFADMRGALHLQGLPAEEIAAEERAMDRNLGTAGHYDMDARRHDMDGEGIAAEVVFHSSQNGEVLPFIEGGSLFFRPASLDLERAAVGVRMFNRWLADACGTAPDRHVGLVHLPAWDIDASRRELEWAAEAGLRGVNFPAPRPGIVPYDDPEWETFWRAVAERDMTLNTHAGGAGGEFDFH
jgi:predicted TIM-barrel fold metal-dependent hydrolase